MVTLVVWGQHGNGENTGEPTMSGGVVVVVVMIYMVGELCGPSGLR